MIDFEASVKKMDTTTLPVKRLFDNNNSLNISNKKSKVSPFDDQDKDEDDIPLSNINKRPNKSVDNLFSSLRKELASVKLSFEEYNRNPQVEERRLRSIKRDIEKCCKELENKETQVKKFEGRVKDFESEKTNFESRQKVFELKEKEFKEKEKEFKSKEEKLQSEEEELKGKVKEYHSKLEEFEGKMKKWSKEEFKDQVKVSEANEEELKSKKHQCENQVEDILKFGKDNLTVLQLKENQVEVQIKDVESKLNNSSGQLKELELTEKQCDKEKEFDPSKIVLDIILNPIIPLPKKGDKVVLIDEIHIFLLEQLQIISPNIKSCVKDEALKLAHDLKVNIKENAENCLEVLGFLLILSTYGLLTYFDEDEVLKLFESVAEYKIAVDLRETLGLAN